MLFQAGETADCAYVLQRGSFRLDPEKVGEPELIAGPGTLLGELALFTETRCPATATSLEVSMVLRISRAMFVKMLEGYPTRRSVYAISSRRAPMNGQRILKTSVRRSRRRATLPDSVVSTAGFPRRLTKTNIRVRKSPWREAAGALYAKEVATQLGRKCDDPANVVIRYQR